MSRARRRIVLPGGSGHLGTLLARAHHAAGDEVVVLSRSPVSHVVPWRVVHWDGRTLGDWVTEIDGADAVLHFAGRSVDCRYTEKRKREILDSRVDSTRVVGQAIGSASRPPKDWLQASTATIYAHRFDAPNDERTGLLGGDEPDAPPAWRFSIDVARAWERTLDEAETPATRKVALRTAIVMSPVPGAPFAIHRRLVRLGLGGRFGDGRQFVSWIHDEDFVRAVRFLLDDAAGRALSGPVNLAAPGPLPNADFMRAIREAEGVPFGLPHARWQLALGAFLLRTETELVLKSRRVVATRLREAGFDFLHPDWPEAARDLSRRMRAARGSRRESIGSSA